MLRSLSRNLQDAEGQSQAETHIRVIKIDPAQGIDPAEPVYDTVPVQKQRRGSVFYAAIVLQVLSQV